MLSPSGRPRMSVQDPLVSPIVADPPLLDVRNVSVHFPIRRMSPFAPPKVARAVDDVSIQIAPGETLGLVGESGSGKTTLGRAILRRAPITSGRVIFDGADITTLRGEGLRRLRRDMQLVFQDPYASLNPRMRVRTIVAEPMVVHRIGSGSDIRRRVFDLLRLVGLPEDASDRYPHAFSGGQRQRIGLARALALEPKLIVADEPVSALDVSIRAQVVNLMQELQTRLGIAYLFIAHDLSIVRHISHRVAIMYAGRVMEIGTPDVIYRTPIHPYTEALIKAVPVPDPVVEQARTDHPLAGETPSPIDTPAGCRFAARCPLATAHCRSESPPLTERGRAHFAACWER